MPKRSLELRRCHPKSIVRKLSRALALTALAGAVACSVDSGPWEDGLLLRPNGDIMRAGDVVGVTDSVPGDVMMAGRSLEFDGFAGGSYLGAGGDQNVGGRIDGSVRAAGGAVRLEGSVGRNATLAGGSVVVRDAADIMGNAYLAGGNVRLDGSVSGDVYVGAGEVRVDGDVGGDVRVEAGALRIGPDARIEGELRYRLNDGGLATISTDAVVAGGVVALEPREEGGSQGGVFVLRLFAFVLCGAILVALLPKTLLGTADQMRDRPAAALGLGLLWVLLTPLAVVVSAVTIVGVPLALILAALSALCFYLAPVVPALWFGGQILTGRKSSERGSSVVTFVAGGVIVAFVILLPWVGLVARALATCLGLGAVVLAIQTRRPSSQGG